MDQQAGKAAIGCFLGILVVFGFLVVIFLFIILIEDEDDLDSDSKINPMDPALLTDLGKTYLEINKPKILSKVAPIADRFQLHWVYLTAIDDQRFVKNQEKGCDHHWIEPFYLKELHWVGKEFLNDHPNAKTEFSHCGDVKDEYQGQLSDVNKLKDYQSQAMEEMATCEERARNEKKEGFCRPYGLDADNDGKAELKNRDDAMATTAHLLSDYQRVYGNMGQAFNHLYGENEIFLRSLKNRILAMLIDPSPHGVFRWPLNPDKRINKTVIQRGDSGEGLTIKSQANEKVFAVGSGYVEEVGSNPSCGEYVKIAHPVREGNGLISTTYCHIVDRLVDEKETIQIGQEIGSVKEDSLTVRVYKKNVNEEGQEEEELINPEEYLTAPDDVIFEEEQPEKSDEKGNEREGDQPNN